MRTGISITVTAEDRVRLDTIIGNRNSPQKHVWRARIIVLTADGAGTSAITRAVGEGKSEAFLLPSAEPTKGSPAHAGRDGVS